MSEPEADPETPDGVLVPATTWVGRFEWERLIRRCRLGFYEGEKQDPRRWVPHATVQHVALVLATYADLDGTRVRPSAQRVANVCDLDERRVRACITHLRNTNLLELVRAARSPGRNGGPGRSAEFRMSVPDDLLERVAHLDPDEQVVVVPTGAPMPPERKPRGRKPGTAAGQGAVDIS